MFDGARDMDLLAATGAVTPTRSRHRWRRAWSLWGPLLPIALAAGLVAGAAIVVIGRGFST